MTISIENYKELVKKLRFYLENSIWNDEDIIDPIIQPIKGLICKHIGHNVISDHCGRPEHDFCVTCLRAFPGKAENEHYFPE